MEPSSVSDEDLICFIKQILQNCQFSINYKSLKELVEQATHLKSYVNLKYSEEMFLNFLLSNSDVFSVDANGSVVLSGAVEYVLPHSDDVLDSIPASDDSYYGDREEYVSGSDEESNASMDPDHRLLSNKFLPNSLSQSVNSNKLPSCTLHHAECCIVTSLGDSTTSTDSTPMYLSSGSNSRLISTSTESDSRSSFESCDSVDLNSNLSDALSSSSSYSSCSDS